MSYHNHDIESEPLFKKDPKLEEVKTVIKMADDPAFFINSLKLYTAAHTYTHPEFMQFLKDYYEIKSKV